MEELVEQMFILPNGKLLRISLYLEFDILEFV